MKFVYLLIIFLITNSMLEGEKLPRLLAKSELENYTQTPSKLGFRQSQSSRDSIDRKQVNINNMDLFTIVESRGFGKAEIPSFEGVWVYSPLMRFPSKLAIIMIRQ